MCLFLAVTSVNLADAINRGGVLEDVLGLEDTFWSPWPWPRRSSPWPWPRVLENWPVLGSRTALFFELKFCEALEKFFGKRFFVEIVWKIFVKTFFWRSPKKFLWRPFFFSRALALVSLVLGLGLEHSCSWPRECLSSERLSLASNFFCVLGLGLEPCVLDSTSGNKVAGILKIDLCYFTIKKKTVRTPHSFLIDVTWLF